MTGAPEERTIRERVLPALMSGGWNPDHVLREYRITRQRHEVVGGRVHRGADLRADIVLIHADSGHPLTAVEVKKSTKSEFDGVTQAKDYGARLGLQLVYATNGRVIIEIDLRAGTQTVVTEYRTPEEIWAHYTGAADLNAQAQGFFATPYSRALTDPSGAVKQMRYYQHRAAQAVLQAIARGDRRVLAVLATGAGKSLLAAQLCHVLWENHWPRGPSAPDRRPRILYLADRDVLVNDPYLRYFQPMFGDEETHRIRRDPHAHKRIFFALYQAIEDIYESYDRDFFDLIIVDECHRGSAREDNAWRAILDHFGAAVQLGLTATPRVDGEADNLAYFGDAVFTYSLREGIEDGFLAPFQVIRAAMSSDIDGVHIDAGTVDDDGLDVPEGDYTIGSFERRLILPARTQAAAEIVSDHLERTDRMHKTIVFCVNQEHAARFAAAIGNLNADLVAVSPHWAQRITSDEGERGAVLLSRFQQSDEAVPVVVTSSDMLTTGVDAPNVRNIVFLTTVRSTARFKQMLGRGTRLDEEHGKEFFTVIDFTGATARFSDADFDGPAIRDVAVAETVTAPEPAVVDEPDGEIVREPEAPFLNEDGGVFEEPDDQEADPIVIDRDEDIDEVRRRGQRFTLSGQEVVVVGRTIYVVDTAHGVRLRAVRIEDWVRDRVLDLGYDQNSLRRQWADAVSRRELRGALADRLPVDVDELGEALGHPEADPLDLMLHLTYGSALRSRGERASRLLTSRPAFLEALGQSAREVIDRVVEKYVENGPRELDLEVLQVPPLSDMGSVVELAERFGGAEGVGRAFDDLNRELYAS